MFTTYEQAVDWIHARLRLGIKPGLSRMEWMLEKLDHPERHIKTIHIGGTNGKGSTVTFLTSVLQSAGYQIGTFTSPYFEQFNERISINGKPVKDEEIVEMVNVIKPLADELEQTDLGGPTEFEVITAMSLYYFAKMNPVDVVLYEVGLGGRFDSTNVIHPLLSIITSIGLDHTAILGDTLEQIAFEKAGIIKNGVNVITGVKQPEAIKVIEERASNVKATLHQLGKKFSISQVKALSKGTQFDFSSTFGEFKDLEISMIGEHQASNASLAVMATQLLRNYYAFLIEEEHIRQGLKDAYWPGRFEIVSEEPYIVLDGAHNNEGIQALVAVLKERYSDKKITILFTALADKSVDEMIRKLDEVADRIVFTEFDYPRAATAEMLFSFSSSDNKSLEKNWFDYLKNKIPSIQDDEILVITGSLYFLSEVKSSLITIYKG
ncbi:bifunctional folylpolyglutamate synthase/dihydrofolate synthase [Mesobacillus maritimus]|uniref:bifunctional folylpolyglutamate synthase/dihydrofolate synthase n=1 Tax=Mesobacillus maritimus TaxID=1643336 RepID=UPI00203C6B7B|nr:folylpolyglutamate synthase/dihydrofolate synthase family protein [Mesobacillus maritimus]MCM3587652.1 bifunctional folylpolyglutamate synthase/dihydrofolate synthase [Mesobacillus maritimus]